VRPSLPVLAPRMTAWWTSGRRDRPPGRVSAPRLLPGPGRSGSERGMREGGGARDLSALRDGQLVVDAEAPSSRHGSLGWMG
jgi:hypothetical protein